MKTKQKLSILFCAFLVSMLPSCFATVHESASIQPKMSVTEAVNSVKETMKDTIHIVGDDKVNVVTNVAISDEGVAFYYVDNTNKYFAFKDIQSPSVMEVNNFGVKESWVRLKPGIFGDAILFKNSKSAIMFADALYYLKHHDVKKERAQGNEDCLRVVRSTAVNVILNGSTMDELAIPCEVNREAAESILNELLIQWKNKGFPEQLQKSSSLQLRDLVIDLEKGILKLDLKTKKLKDLADEDARQVTAPGQAAPAKKAPGALSLSHLLDQRKTILMVILGSVKQAAAQRASGG